VAGSNGGGVIGAGPVRPLEVLLREPGRREDPYALYAELRARGGLVPVEDGTWLAADYESARRILRDPRLSTSNKHNPGHADLRVTALELGFGPLLQLMEDGLLFLDPPDHTRLRRLAGKAFSARVVQAERARLAVMVDELLGAGDGDTYDVVRGLASPSSFGAACEILGVPLADAPTLRPWTDAAVLALDPGNDPGVFVTASVGVGHLLDYFRALLGSRDAWPPGALIGEFRRVEEEDERLTEDEIVLLCVMLLVAGVETTVNLVGNAVRALADDDRAAGRLRDSPDRIPVAVEEFLRYDSPVQFSWRTAVEPVELGDVVVGAGEKVAVVIGSANRDPGRFTDPDVLDVDRADNRHLAFGGGIHVCLGAALARVLTEISIGAVLARFPRLEVVGEPPRKETVTLRGLDSLVLARVP